MERSSFFAHVLLLIAVAIYSAEAGSCKLGRWACVASCKFQKCATGYCASRDSICRCSRCGTGSSQVSPRLENPADVQWRKSPFAGIQQDAGTVGRPAHPQIQETLSVSQNVDVEELMTVLSNEEILKRFRELNFDVITIHEIISEGWGSNPKKFSDDFGILRKYVATKEEGLKLLEELEDIFSELLGQETKEALESILKPQPDNDRFKRQLGSSIFDPIQLGGGFYFDISPPSIGFSSGGFNVNLAPDYSFQGGSLNINGGKLTFTITF